MWDNHVIHAAALTEKITMDFQVVDELCEQIDIEVEHVSADNVYDTLSKAFQKSDIIIFPKDNGYKRMSYLAAYSELGLIRCPKEKGYGKRNVSENSMRSYQSIMGPKLHRRDVNNQQQEMILDASILNGFTQLGMPDSYRVV